MRCAAAATWHASSVRRVPMIARGIGAPYHFDGRPTTTSSRVCRTRRRSLPFSLPRGEDLRPPPSYDITETRDLTPAGRRPCRPLAVGDAGRPPARAAVLPPRERGVDRDRLRDPLHARAGDPH